MQSNNIKHVNSLKTLNKNIGSHSIKNIIKTTSSFEGEWNNQQKTKITYSDSSTSDNLTSPKAQQTRKQLFSMTTNLKIKKKVKVTILKVESELLCSVAFRKLYFILFQLQYNRILPGKKRTNIIQYLLLIGSPANRHWCTSICELFNRDWIYHLIYF